MSVSPSTSSIPAGSGASKSMKALIVGAIVVVLVIGLTFLIFKLTRPAPPPPSSDVVTLAKFLTTSRYKSMQEVDQRAYMKAARKNLDAAATALANGQIKQDEFFAIYLNGYMERKIGDMRDYFALPAAKREETLLKEYQLKAKAPAAAATKPSDRGPKPDDKTEKDFLDEMTKAWPSEQRAQWEEFRQAVKRAKEAAKKTPAK